MSTTTTTTTTTAPAWLIPAGTYVLDVAGTPWRVIRTAVDGGDVLLYGTELECVRYYYSQAVPVMPEWEAELLGFGDTE